MPGHQKQPKPRVCAHCGTSFMGLRRGRYCSDSCKMKAYRARKARRTARETVRG